MAPIMTKAGGWPHGTRACYVNHGCRCDECRTANREYARNYYRAARIGANPGRLVPAAPVREHLLHLSEQGVGKRRVAELSGVASSVVDKIRRGERKCVRWSTEQAILGVAVDDGALAQLVDREAADAVIAVLLRCGFRRYQIAALLGSGAKTPSLQLARSERVTRKTLRKLQVLRQLHLRGLVRP